VKFLETALPGVIVIQPRILGDRRGFFMETWHRVTFRAAGIDVDFMQDNHSRSVKGTLRGLHYQLRRPQGKLVRVVAGEVFDVSVDLRRSSPTFGRSLGVKLSATDATELWIPPGLAHGFYVTSDSADLLYKCTDVYVPEDERTIRWDDPTLAIDWPIGAEPPVLSARDEAGVAFADAEVYG
jgi:dTDP-4-dehydrorhamnose 3,5-epimerase